ncbi:unnamed protein product [Discosporangium mesarthrocarpum]
MKAAVVSDFGDVDAVLTVIEDHPRPVLKKGSGKMLVRVQACSLSPGDCRMINGDAKIVKKPPSWPYVPGGDVCGVVEEVDEDSKSKFRVGDSVVGSWENFGIGGMAELTLVDTKLAVKKPPNLIPVEAAAMANSPVNALLAVRDAGIKSGHRVLIIGGSGGMGTSIVQMARDANAAFIAVTSTDDALMKSLGVDVVVDYSMGNWWEAPELKGPGGEPFDVIIDCAEGSSTWTRVQGDRSLIKAGSKGGRFLAVVWNEWTIIIERWSDMFGLMCPVLGRVIMSRVRSSSVPKYSVMFPAPRGDNTMEELFALAEEGKVKPVLDKSSPFPFTTEGVRGAFRLQESRHAHGKVVVEIA